MFDLDSVAFRGINKEIIKKDFNCELLISSLFTFNIDILSVQDVLALSYSNLLCKIFNYTPFVSKDRFLGHPVLHNFYVIFFAIIYLTDYNYDNDNVYDYAEIDYA